MGHSKPAETYYLLLTTYYLLLTTYLVGPGGTLEARGDLLLTTYYLLLTTYYLLGWPRWDTRSPRSRWWQLLSRLSGPRAHTRHAFAYVHASNALRGTCTVCATGPDFFECVSSGLLANKSSDSRLRCLESDSGQACACACACPYAHARA